MPRKAKVAANAQMDISSFALSRTNTAPTTSTSSTTTTTTRQPPRNFSHQQLVPPTQQQQSRPTIKIRTSGPIPTTSSFKNGVGSNGSLNSRDSSNTIRVSNANNTTRNNNSNGVIRRMPSGSAVGLGVSASRLQKEGSVTSSDDGTVSEDSVDDHIQLFSGAGGGGSGGLHVNSIPFGSSSRQGALSPSSSSGPKVKTRPKSATSSTLSSGIVTTAKPMRIAAGASIRIDTNSSSSSTHAPIPSLSVSGSQPLNVTAGTGGGANAGASAGLLSTSVSSSSSSSSSSVSWVSSPSHRNGEENNVTSPTSANSNNNNSNSMPVSPQPSSQGQGHQTTIRTAKPSAAAAAKQAEESRRAEEAARTRRKIQDLEISNASLLQVNQTLEATIRKQTAEMQELKMRIQSAQFGGDLSLLADMNFSQDVDPLAQIDGTVADSEAAVIIHELTEAERQADLTFKRLCITIEQMIFEAKQAVDQSTKKAGVKVLSSFDMYEKESMQDEADDDELDAADQSIVLQEGEYDDEQKNDLPKQSS
ncbi:hypothetical protein BGZ46_002316 [Entomortierella lignicola]|nr:hypothetical protein BGZ46_002316 [Entomortierella lignicola]